MGQAFHGSATATETVRRAIKNVPKSIRTLTKRYGNAIAKLPLLLVCLVLLLSFTPTLAVPPNFANDTLILNLNFPTSIAFLPDGRMLITELNGVIRIVQAGASTVDPTPFLTVPNVLADEGERGLHGITLDPDFSSNGYFYVFYSCSNPRRDRVTRFKVSTTNPNQADPASQTVIWQDNIEVPRLHHGGTIVFGNDGKMYISVGDAGYDNPTRAQQLTNFRGKILRINRDGTIPTDNPFYDGNGPNYDAIWALGLRNPFRITYDSVSGRMFIGDVGNATYEEVNEGVAGANYGWPHCEGSTCLSPAPANYRPPLFSYVHTNGRSASLTLGFVYRGGQFPGAYNGSLFYGDYSQNWIRRLTFDPFGNFTGSVNFEPNSSQLDGPYGEIVDLKQGPEGALYYVSMGTGPNLGMIRRIKYTGANQPPVITSASAAPTSGPGPSLTVTFSGAATDADNDPLLYGWEFGDGTDSEGANITHTYTQSGQYTARMIAYDGENQTLSDPITIHVGSPPSATITAPLDGRTFRAGDVITFTGTATDPDGPLTDANYAWTVDLLHLDHIHPAQGVVSGTSGTFTIPTNDHDLNNTTRYRITLTVTDASGQSDTEMVTIYPETVNLTFASLPPGLVVNLNGVPHVAPFTIKSVINFQHVLDAPVQQQAGGVNYQFVSWSDGRAPSHTITVGTTGGTYTANYQAPLSPTATATPLTATPSASSTPPPPPPAYTYQPSPTYTVTPSLTPTITASWSPTPSITPTFTSTSVPTQVTFPVASPTATPTPRPSPPPYNG